MDNKPPIQIFTVTLPDGRKERRVLADEAGDGSGAGGLVQKSRLATLDEIADALARQASEALQAADKKWGRIEPVDLEHLRKTGEIRPQAKVADSQTLK